MRWLPKSKNDICSEDVFKRFEKFGVTVANRPDNVEVAPWMLYEWALANPEQCKIRTVWIGEDFKNG